MNKEEVFSRAETAWYTIEEQRKIYRAACQRDESHRLDARVACRAWHEYGSALLSLRETLGSDTELKTALAKLKDRPAFSSEGYRWHGNQPDIAVWIAVNWPWISEILAESPYWPREPYELQEALKTKLLRDRWSPDMETAQRSSQLLLRVFGIGASDPELPAMLEDASVRLSEQLQFVLREGPAILHVVVWDPWRRSPATWLLELKVENGYLLFLSPDLADIPIEKKCSDSLGWNFDLRRTSDQRQLSVDALDMAAVRAGINAELHLGLESTWELLEHASVHRLSLTRKASEMVWEAQRRDLSHL